MDKIVTRHHQVFISFTKDGHDRARNIKTYLEERFSSSVWIWNEKLRVGDPTITTFSKAVWASDYFIPILSPGYNSSPGAQTELRIALEKENSLQKHYGMDTKFILPYIDGWGIKIPTEISYKFAARNNRDIGKVLKEDSNRFNLDHNPFTFTTWPKPFVSEDGEVNTIVVVGHSGKESPPSNDDLGIFSDYIDVDETPRNQSLRPVAFLPNIISYLQDEANNQKIKNGFRGRLHSRPIECHIDWHLLKFRKELIRSSNIISLGAGDTNLISRWVFSYYQKYLPIHFDTPVGSQTIYSDSIGSLDILSLDQVESGLQLYGAVLLILPNPLNRERAVVIVAGLTALGTQAAILALSQPSDELRSGGVYPGNYARILKGVEDHWRAVGYEFIR